MGIADRKSGRLKGLFMFLRFLRFSAILIALSFCLQPAARAETTGKGQDALPKETLIVESGGKEHRFVVEVAASEQQRAMGLMFREEMAADHGMLFVFEGEGDRYFWMKNTPLPLDILFIGATGRIVGIAADTIPYSEAVIPSGAPARFVLELNAGTSARLGMNVGDTASSPSMKVE